jgi:hypothetical protein
VKEYTFIVDTQLTHIDKCSDARAAEIAEQIGGVSAWKKYLAKRIRTVLMEDPHLDVDDVQVKSVQIFERDVEEDCAEEGNN